MAIKCDYPKSNPIFALQLNMPTTNERTSVLNAMNNNSVRVCIFSSLFDIFSTNFFLSI